MPAEGCCAALRQDQKRAGSFTFARQAPRAGSEQSEFTFRRATASEPCEAMAFPRLGRHHPSPLSHHASLAKVPFLSTFSPHEVKNIKHSLQLTQ